MKNSPYFLISIRIIDKSKLKIKYIDVREMENSQLVFSGRWKQPERPVTVETRDHCMKFVKNDAIISLLYYKFKESAGMVRDRRKTGKRGEERS